MSHERFKRHNRLGRAGSGSGKYARVRETASGNLRSIQVLAPHTRGPCSAGSVQTRAIFSAVALPPKRSSTSANHLHTITTP
jgi:hypothetical protein